MTGGSHSPVITADGRECDGRATKGGSVVTVEFQQNVGGFSDSKGHWYSVRRIGNRYVVVILQKDAGTHRHVLTAATSEHVSAEDAWIAARERAERSAAGEQKY